MCAREAIGRDDEGEGGNCYDDARISPVIRQTLQHWASVLTERDVDDAIKKMAKG